MTDTPPDAPRFDVLFRPLWRLDRQERARQRCQLLLALPFAAVGGLAFGVFWARQTDAAIVEIGILSALGLCALVYLQIVVTPLMTHLVGRVFGQGMAPMGELLWDGAAGGVAAFAATRFLGVEVLPAVGLAAALGALYAVGLAYALCGGAAADAVGFLSGAGARGSPRKPDYSYPAALAARGRTAEALDEYRGLVEADPSEPEPYLLAARLLREEKSFQEEVRWLERARDRADLSVRQRIRVARRIIDIWRAEMDRPRKAAPELARLAERFPDTEAGSWARTELAELKDEMARELGLDEGGEHGEPGS